MLRGLEAEHVRGRDLTAHLFDALDAFEKAGAPAAPAFSDLLAEYAQFQWEHMRREEEDVLPRARRVMSEADWREVDAAFAANADPIAGVSLDREFRDLFHTIVNLAPPPIGVGPSARR
jgi:hemerythrin-like domain-containing protein